MGGRASLRERQGRNVWRVVRWSDAISCGNRETSAPCGNFSERYSLQLSRWLDVPGRSVRAVVQRIVDHGTGVEHNAQARRCWTERGGLDENASANELQSARGAARNGRSSVFCGL